jgi:hypothetical protein
MEMLLLWIGRLAGVAGLLIALAAVLARGSGQYVVAGLQVGTLLQAGIAAMVLGCLGYVASIAERQQR